MRPTTIYSLSAELGANTIDPDKLNCRVRNGNGCCLIGIIISLIPTPFEVRPLYKEQICLTKELSDGTTIPLLKRIGIFLAVTSTGHRLPSNLINYTR